MAITGAYRLVRDLWTNRGKPDLKGLHRIEDSEAFLWAVLPHAARTFSKSIHLLPRAMRKPCAVAYLFARILDTYEDHIKDATERDEAMAQFAARFAEHESGALAVPRAIQYAHDADARDEVHRLLLHKHALIDREFHKLSFDVREPIRELIEPMALGMRKASAWFDQQGGVLQDDAQLKEYCHAVLGHPVLFTARLLRLHRTETAELTPSEVTNCFSAGVMVQLANVTRDIEKDLARGIAYHPLLSQDVERVRAENPPDPAVGSRIRSVRAELTLKALALSPNLASLLIDLAPSGLRPERASGVLLFLHTNRHYLRSAIQAGIKPWGVVVSPTRILLKSIPAALSAKRAKAILNPLVRLHLATVDSKHG
jgi:phytoene/squalene synthetase